MNIPYLSVAECILRYLTHHTAISPEDALAGEKNIQDMVAAVLVFVRFPGWTGKRTRLQYVLWELHDSGIVLLMVKLREDAQGHDLVTPKLVGALRRLLTLVEEELLSDSWLGEFWREKFDSVDGALVRLEALFDKDAAEGMDSVGDSDGAVITKHTVTPKYTGLTLQQSILIAWLPGQPLSAVEHQYTIVLAGRCPQGSPSDRFAEVSGERGESV